MNEGTRTFLWVYSVCMAYTVWILWEFAVDAWKQRRKPQRIQRNGQTNVTSEDETGKKEEPILERDSITDSEDQDSVNVSSGSGRFLWKTDDVH